MSEEVYANILFSVAYKDEKQRDELLRILDPDIIGPSLFESDYSENLTVEDVPASKKIKIESGTESITEGFDEELDKIYKQVREAGSVLRGYLEVYDGYEVYRGDLKENGDVDYEEVNYFAMFNVEQLRELKRYAADRFHSENVYDVKVSRKISGDFVYTVKAKNVQEASDKALELAHKDPNWDDPTSHRLDIDFEVEAIDQDEAEDLAGERHNA